jgi:hypothetical protein
MPGDPMFDEDHIIHLLQSPVKVENIDLLQSGAVQTICDLYDRKATRDEFIAGLALGLQLYGMLAKFWLLDNIEETTKKFDGNLPQDKWDIARAQSVAVITEQRRSMVDLVERLKQCPTSKDPIS